MSDSSSASDDEQDSRHDQSTKTQRKKSNTRRSFDLQRKISLNKLKEERENQTQNQHQQINNNSVNHVSIKASDSSTSPTIETPSVPLKHGKCRLTRNGKLLGGYEQYNLSLLHVPMPKDYGEPSSDDLSSEWDSDVPCDKTNGAPKESKVRKKKSY